MAVNPLAAKNFLPSNPWEFGYAIGASRPLALKANAARCNFCRENLIAGVEMHGGLGDTGDFGLHQTSHYLAPAVAWNLPSGWTLRVSHRFALSGNSHRWLVQMGPVAASSTISAAPPSPNYSEEASDGRPLLPSSTSGFARGLLLPIRHRRRRSNNWEGRARDTDFRKAPARARLRSNPLAGDREAVVAGKKMFREHCAQCHGEAAEGGPRGSESAPGCTLLSGIAPC
jgi:hypothetical protein